jgi:hypothetical protein
MFESVAHIKTGKMRDTIKNEERQRISNIVGYEGEIKFKIHIGVGDKVSILIGSHYKDAFSHLKDNVSSFQLIITIRKSIKPNGGIKVFSNPRFFILIVSNLFHDPI